MVRLLVQIVQLITCTAADRRIEGPRGHPAASHSPSVEAGRRVYSNLGDNQLGDTFWSTGRHNFDVLGDNVRSVIYLYSIDHILMSILYINLILRKHYSGDFMEECVASRQRHQTLSVEVLETL